MGIIECSCQSARRKKYALNGVDQELCNGFAMIVDETSKTILQRKPTLR